MISSDLQRRWATATHRRRTLPPAKPHRRLRPATLSPRRNQLPPPPIIPPNLPPRPPRTKLGRAQRPIRYRDKRPGLSHDSRLRPPRANRSQQRLRSRQSTRSASWRRRPLRRCASRLRRPPPRTRRARNSRSRPMPRVDHLRPAKTRPPSRSHVKTRSVEAAIHRVNKRPRRRGLPQQRRRPASPRRASHRHPERHNPTRPTRRPPPGPTAPAAARRHDLSE